MSDKRQLSPEAIKLLLQLLEAPAPLLAAPAADLHPVETEQLIRAGLLTAYDHEDVATFTDDHSDTPVSVTWSEQMGGLTYFSPAAGPVRVQPEQLLRRRLNVTQALTAMTSDFGVPNGSTPFELIEGLVWEIGAARLGKRTSRVPVWFARRIWSSTVQRQIAKAARNRPHPRHRVVLTSSRPERVGDFAIAGATIVPLQDVLTRPDVLAVDPEILGARLSGVQVSNSAQPIELSPDGTRLRINGGDPIVFRSPSQIAAIRRLVAAHQAGEGVRVSEITHLGSLARFFSNKKWAALSPYLKSANGLWTFKP